MEGLSASVVLIAIMLGVLLVVVFDIVCLLRLATADTGYFLPKFAWAVLIVCTSPIGGLVYLLAQRLPKRSPEPVAMRPRPLLGQKAWYGPAHEGHGHSPDSPEGHAVTVVATAAAVYLALAGQGLAAVVVVVALVIIVFLNSTPPGNAQQWKEFQARRDQRPDRRALQAINPATSGLSRSLTDRYIGSPAGRQVDPLRKPTLRAAGQGERLPVRYRC